MILLVFLIATFFLLRNFKETVLIYTPFKFLFTNSVVLVGSVSFDNAISLLICFLFFFHYFVKEAYRYIQETWPLLLSFVFLCVSESISALIDEPNVISIPLKFCRNYGYCLVLYCLIAEEKDLTTIIDSLSLYIILLVGNGIVQFVTGINIIGDWILDSMKESAFFAEDVDYGIRGIRINSFLGHSICFGDVCAIFLLVFVYFYRNNYRRQKSVIIIILLVIGVLLSNSRTPLLALMIYLLPVLTDKEIVNKYRSFYIFGIPLAILFISIPIYHMLDSMFNENTIYDTGGSNMTMRLEQLEASIDVVGNSFIWGLGYSFDFEDIKELRGAESVWFNLLMYQGIVGCLCYLFLIVQAFYNTRHYSCYKYIFFMTLGYFVQQSATYNAGLNEFLFYFCLILLISHSEIIAENLQEEMLESESNRLLT